MRLIILLLTLFSLCFALPVVNIESDKFKITDFELGYLVDSNSSLTFENIKNKDKLYLVSMLGSF